MAKTYQVLLWTLLLAFSYSVDNSANITDSIAAFSVTSYSTSADFTNFTIIQSGISQEGVFSSDNDNSTHYWKLENVNQSQVVYLSLSPHNGNDKDDLNVELFRPSGESYSQILEPTVGSTDYLASWLANEFGDWIIQVNDTSQSNFTYTMLVVIPTSAYSENSAILVNETPTIANFTISHESHYWQVLLEENQVGTINLKEITPTILRVSKITIYRAQNPLNPILLPSDIFQSKYNYSWNAPATDTYFVEITHKAEKSYPIGQYNVSFTAETAGYDFKTALEIPYNQTFTVNVDQGFIPRKRYYFTFKVNVSRTLVDIRVFELNTTTSTILDYAIVEIFDEGRQSPKLAIREEEEDRDGQINISEKLDTGIYYLRVTPESNAVGTFQIFLEYRLPQPFVWNVLAILLTISTVIVFPVYLIYLDSKGKWYRVSQWTVSSSIQNAYKIFRNSFRGIYNIKEVPSDSILIHIASIPFRTYAILNFVESSENETLIFSKRINRKYEWGIYVLVGLSVFDALNIGAYLLFSVQFLPLYFANLTSLILILAIPTISLLIIVLFTNGSSYMTYSQVYNRISYIIQNFEDSEENTMSSLSMDPIQAAKSVNYVRVLWNQARHAFKNQNYELFVIKADAAVKNLLSTRYLQICPINSQTKADFQTQVVELRKRGFDLPNEKKIAHFRNLRNRIVHSSVTLGEKESVDCFAYYSTFITRLGLRPT
ncbi:hypothetical protein CEE45_09280 [Candidatus Heimdallarchaeota archaeon B3_Heim]|nr:MAG: hypothetical protein CEE45_09280 [Candidatus Heimdallarchaeota archaeon B3_Heim]